MMTFRKQILSNMTLNEVICVHFTIQNICSLELISKKRKYYKNKINSN
jgi:hypothetical protein